MFKIYCVHPISGLSADEVFEYYVDIEKTLTVMGYDVLHPMFGKEFLRTEMKFKAEDNRSPLTTNHSIVERDHWMVYQSDIVYANLTGAEIVSIGSVMELAWAYMYRKQTIVVMEEKNIHRHAFVMEAADIIFETQEEALFYLEKLSNKRI